MDRVDNNRSHTYNNCVIACEACNKARSYRNFYSFYDEKCLERFSKERHQVYLIDDGNKKVFYKLKHNIVGGPSLVFCRDIMKPIKHIFKDMNLMI